MHVKEFIQDYTPLEIEKLERKDVLSRFQNKVAVQSIAAHLSSVTVETNPIGNTDNDKIVRRAVNNNVPALAKTHRPQLTKEQIEINQKAKE